MTGILSLQRRLHQAGRIRIGTSVPAKSRAGKDFRRPVKLDSFLFTSSNVRALHRIAETFGGNVEPWDEAPGAPQSKVLTETDEIPVLVPPESMAFSQAFEHWDAGRCMRRCDGEHEALSDGTCQCDPDNRLCKPTTRLSLMLPQVAGSGLWRLDVRGYYAAVELSGAFGLAEILAAASGRSIIPGVLRLTQREVKREDPETHKTITHKFAVPVIDFDLGPALPSLVAGTNGEFKGIGNGHVPELSSGLTPIPPGETATLAEELQNVGQEPPAKRRNGQQPIPRTGLAPRARGTALEPPEDPPSDSDASEDDTETIHALQVQMRALFDTFDRLPQGAARIGYVREKVGREDVKVVGDLSADELRTVMAALECDIAESSEAFDVRTSKQR